MARHPESGEPILASIGRYGPYVQHGKIYANIGKDDDVLEIGANRAIDLIVAKEAGGGFRRGAADPGRPLGEDPESAKPIVVKAGRFGPYVTDGETNATLPKSITAEAVTLEEAIALLIARRAAGPSKKPARGRKAAAKKPPTKKAPAKKAAVKKSAAPNAAAKTATTAKKAPAKKSAAKKSAVKKTAVKKVAVKKAV